MITARHTTLLAAVLIVLTLAGCGKDSAELSDDDAAPRDNAGSVETPAPRDDASPAEEPAPTANARRAQIRAEVERVWNDVQDALRAGDGERLCSHTTAAYAQRLVKAAGAANCAGVARDASKVFNKTVPADAKPTYSSFSTKGDRAAIRATLASNDGPRVTVVRMRLVRGAWEVNGDSGLDGG